jgi:hypothetical protein
MRGRHWRTVVAATAALSMALASVAVADELYADGDGVAPVGSNAMAFGEVCAESTTSKTALLAIRRQAAVNSGNVFANSANVTIERTSVSGSGLTEALVGSTTISLPATWQTANTGVMSSQVVTSEVNFEAPATPGPFTGSVSYSASGPQAGSDGTLTRTETMNVTAQVIACEEPDETPPNVTITLDPSEADGINDWYVSPVTVMVEADDDESDVESIEYRYSFGEDDSSWQPYTESVVFNVDGVYEFEARASSAGGTSEAESVSFKIDATPPVVTVTGVESGAVYTLGSVPEAGCNTTDATSGVATPAVASTIGGPVGSVTTTCSGATDKAGNQADPVSVTYSVRYDFAGFFRPVDMGTAEQPVFNRVKAGQAIPMKFTLDGDQSLDILKDGWPKSYPVACEATALQLPVEETVTAGKSSLSYDDGQYNFVWKTEKGWAGQCRAFSLGLKDGSTQIAYFSFTR